MNIRCAVVTAAATTLTAVSIILFFGFQAEWEWSSVQWANASCIIAAAIFIEAGIGLWLCRIGKQKSSTAFKSDKLVAICDCDASTCVADVVFIHGLFGDYLTTWHPEGNTNFYWPRILGSRFKDVRVWSLDYEAAGFGFSGNAMAFTERAKQVSDLFRLKGIGDRPLLFICHSLGGIVIKQVLRYANDQRSTSQHSEFFERLSNSRKVIAFLSTPHDGASIASVASYAFGKSVSINDLRHGNPHLLDLTDWFRDNINQLNCKVTVYSENKPYAGVVIVDPATANPGIAGVSTILLGEDHISICKPTNTDSQVFQAIELELSKMVQDPSEKK